MHVRERLVKNTESGFEDSTCNMNDLAVHLFLTHCYFGFYKLKAPATENEALLGVPVLCATLAIYHGRLPRER